jgi:hypothetical protein
MISKSIYVHILMCRITDVVTAGGPVMIVNFIHDSEVKCKLNVVGYNVRKRILRFELNRWITTAAETADAVALLIP